MSKIRKIRKEKGIKAKEICRILNITQGNYYKKENGAIKFSVEEIIILSFIFKENINIMIFDEIVEAEKKWRKKIS
jgi:transcriptional regulator with XRE-family HTH domain